MSEQVEKFEATREDKVESMNLVAGIIGFIVIVGNIMNGTNWILALIIGGLVGAIIDFPFKLYRKHKFNSDLNARRAVLDENSRQLDLAMAKTYRDKDFQFVQGIIGEDNMELDCLEELYYYLSGGSANSIEEAFRMYMKSSDYNEDDDEDYYDNDDDGYRNSSSSGTNKGNTSTGFFAGCDSLDMLNKRYKQLAKCFHPDTGIGDEETMKIINSQYETLKKRFE